MRKKLSAKARATLEVLAKNENASSYAMRASLSSLRALEMRGLAASTSGPGSFWRPQTAILWRITAAGLIANKDATP